MSLVSLAVDGLLQRWPVILHPLTVPARTESTRGPFPQKPAFPKPAVRPIPGASQTDEFALQRYERGVIRPTGPKPEVKTFGGFGGQNAFLIEPTSGVKSYNAPIFYGNLLPKAPVKTYVEQGPPRSPVKTY